MFAGESKTGRISFPNLLRNESINFNQKGHGTAIT